MATLLQRLRAILPRADAIKPIRNTLELAALFRSMMGTDSGAIVNEQTAMRTGVVYACVRILSESVALLPLRLHEQDGETTKIATGHPVDRLLRLQPNRWQSAFEYKRLVMFHMLLAGNHYSLIRRSAGAVRELLPLSPRAMYAEQDPETLAIKYVYTTPAGKQVQLAQDEVLHLRALNSDGVCGLSVIAAAAQAIGLSLTAEKHGARVFRNGAHAGGVLRHPGNLSKEASTRLRESFDEINAGTENAGRTLLLEEGLTFEKVTMTSEEAQFIESRKFQRSDIGMFFGVPPHMYGDTDRTTSWGSGIEQQGVGFVTYTLLPWLTNIEQGMALALLNPDERQRLAPNFDTEPLTRADILARSQAHKIWYDAGVLSPDEWRRREGMGPRPDGQGGVFSAGAQPVGDSRQKPRPH
jgi:HK97 family phage portal protein